MKRALLFVYLAWAFTASAQVPDYVPTDGLVAWYPFNGNANDESSFANHGTVVGATLTTDRFGLPNRAYNFDGNDHIEAPHQDWLNTGTGSKTWAGWGRKTSGNDHAHFLTKIIATSGPYSATNVYLRYAPGEWIEFSEGQSGVGGNGVAIQSNSLLNQWVHLTGVKDADNGTIRIYQNGTLMSEATMQNPQLSFDNSGPLFIGCEHPYVSLPSGPQYFFGDLDDLGIWNRALSETEATALFTGIAPVPGCTEETACNYDTDANVDDGSCIPSGCMEEDACNYNADAQCEGEACDYSCCPGPGCCGDGMHWDAGAQTCVITPPSVAPDAECTVMNLQELAEGYQVLLDHTADQDSIILALQDSLTSCTNGPAAANSQTCAGEEHVTFDGYDYDVVEIGDQCWFAENLRTTTYLNGDVIPEVTDDAQWGNLSTGARCEHPAPEINTTLSGLLYNWWVVNDSRGVCPSGWHVPSHDEWKQLEATIGMSQAEIDGLSADRGTSAHKIKSAIHWDGTDEFGFNAVPAGSRSGNADGAFDTTDNVSAFWTSTPSTGAWYRALRDNQPAILAWNDGDGGDFGMSIRCVKD